jgi:hypothetical protein
MALPLKYFRPFPPNFYFVVIASLAKTTASVLLMVLRYSFLWLKLFLSALAALAGPALRV